MGNTAVNNVVRFEGEFKLLGKAVLSAVEAPEHLKIEKIEGARYQMDSVVEVMRQCDVIGEDAELEPIYNIKGLGGDVVYDKICKLLTETSKFDAVEIFTSILHEITPLEDEQDINVEDLY